MKKITTLVLLFAIIITIVLIYRSYTIDPLQDAVSPVATSTPTLITTATFVCQENKSITASFYKIITTTATGTTETGSVNLTLSDGRIFSLPQAISADGGRYTNPDESFVFWNKGNGVMILENDSKGVFVGCVLAAPQSTNLPAVFVPTDATYSLRLPSLGSTSQTYNTASHTYSVGRGVTTTGTTFPIPAALATGTNVSSDTYLSIEKLDTANCIAPAFLTEPATGTVVTDGDTRYTYASTTGAGAGNRYEEIVYALPQTAPCIGIRYYIHYSLFENYATGTVTQFDRTGLIHTFDEIRRSLVINQ